MVSALDGPWWVGGWVISFVGEVFRPAGGGPLCTNKLIYF